MAEATMTTRRSFITGLVSFVAAPAIVRVSSIMPVKVVDQPWLTSEQIINLALRRINPPTVFAVNQTFKLCFDSVLAELRYVEVNPWIEP